MDVMKINNVSKSFYNKDGELEVISNLSLEVKENEILSIVGPSGCGKSTLLNILSGLEMPTTGDIFVDGDIGYMFQRDNLLEWRTVYQNVLLGLELRKQKGTAKIEFIENMLKKYGLWEFRNHYPRQLSGGMRQRVALIRTLAINPRILLLDEPFSALDYQTRLTVNDDVHRIIKSEGKTTILVTHDISEAISLGDRVAVLSQRPMNIKAIHEIRFELENRTPFTSRTEKNFKDYFDLIWRELHNE